MSHSKNFASQSKVYFSVRTKGIFEIAAIKAISGKIREGTDSCSETVLTPSKLIFIPYINIKYYSIKIFKGFYKLSSLSVKDSILYLH